MNPVNYSTTHNEHVIVKVSKIHGRGLFAKKDIAKGTKMIEYVGEIISHEEADRRELINDELGATYICCLDDDKFIDGAVGGNESICANHSCHPNCEIESEQNRLWFFASKDIKKDEEITFDYSFSNENDEKTPCHCKHHKCRGHMEELIIQN